MRQHIITERGHRCVVHVAKSDKDKTLPSPFLLNVEPDLNCDKNPFDESN